MKQVSLVKHCLVKGILTFIELGILNLQWNLTIPNSGKSKGNGFKLEVMGNSKQEAISQKEIVFRFRKDIQSLRNAGVLVSCA